MEYYLILKDREDSNNIIKELFVTETLGKTYLSEDGWYFIKKLEKKFLEAMNNDYMIYIMDEKGRKYSIADMLDKIIKNKLIERDE